MRSLVAPSFAVLSLFYLPLSAYSQGESALPFLLISPSPEANGMAGTSVAVKRTDPLGAVFSPAQVGLASLTTGVNGSFYPSKTEWLPQYNLSDLNYNAWAVQGGVRLNDFLDLPVRVGLGLAYHRVDLNLGKFSVTNSSGPEVIGTFDSYENASGLTFGVGFEYLLRAGFGYTFRSISSHLSPIGTEMEHGTGIAEVPSKDYGGYVLLPVVELLEAVTNNVAKSNTGLRAFADLSLGFAINNIGDKVVYVDAAQADPLPRTARAGVGVAAGARYEGWELVGATWSREGEDLLVVRHNDGTWEYQSGFGDLDFGSNVVAGHSSGNVGLRTGWQLQLGEFFTYRQGTYTQRYVDYEMSGMTFQLSGVLKAVTLAFGRDVPSWLPFARDHVDVLYHQSEYDGGSLDDTQFKALTLVIHVMPL
jgi:hypothetical protein